MTQHYKIKVDKFLSHQHSNNHSRFGAYKKPKNKLYEEDIVNQLVAQHGIYNHNQFNGTISLSITYFVKIPTTINKVRLKANERRETANKYANVKPDLTNITKTIEDCFERAEIISNDMNIVKYDNIEKYFNDDPKDKSEYAYVTIRSIDNKKNRAFVEERFKENQALCKIDKTEKSKWNYPNGK